MIVVLYPHHNSPSCSVLILTNFVRIAAESLQILDVLNADKIVIEEQALRFLSAKFGLASGEEVAQLREELQGEFEHQQLVETLEALKLALADEGEVEGEAAREEEGVVDVEPLDEPDAQEE